MSRNFELLRQAGWSQEYFQDVPPESRTEKTSRRRHKLPPRGNDQVSALVRRIFLNPLSADVRSVMFARITQRSGCTWTCAQAAKILADAIDGTVCAVDANFQTPALHQHFGEEAHAGLSDAIAGSKPIYELAQQVKGANLWLVAAGLQCERAKKLASNAVLETHLRELKSRFDYLLVDSEIAGSGYGSPAGCRSVDGVVLVADARQITPKAVLVTRKKLESAHVSLFGVVLNQNETELPSFLERLMK
jgi:Mrp family chromosome partitioning ATPase